MRFKLQRCLADKLLNFMTLLDAVQKKNPDQFHWKDCRLKSLREKGVLSRSSDIALAYIDV